MGVISLILLVLSIAFPIISSAQQEHPGSAIRINRRGLNYAKDVLVGMIEQSTRGQMLDPLVKDSGSLQYNVHNIRMTRFNLGSTSVSTQAPNIFTASVTGARFQISASWSGSYKFWIFQRTYYSGTVSVSGSDIDWSQSVGICSNANGQPTFTSTQCTPSVGDFNVKVGGSPIQLILNILKVLFRNTIRNFLERKICEISVAAVTEGGPVLTNAYDVNFNLSRGIFANLGLVGCPEATSTSIAVDVQGEIFCPTENPNQTYPFNATELPPFPDSVAMAQVSLGQYTFNTFIYSFWQKGVFSRTFSLDELRNLLNLDSNTVLPIPGAQFAGGSRIEDMDPQMFNIVINAPTSPTVTFNQGSMNLLGQAQALLTSGSDIPNISVVVDISLIANASVVDNLLMGTITDVDVTASSVTGLPISFRTIINQMFETYIPILLLPLISNFTNVPLAIPPSFGIQVENLFAELKENALDISGDLRRVV